MKKTVLFVPGFKEDVYPRDYHAVLKAIEAKGYDVKFIETEWRRTTIHDWTKQLHSQFKHYDSETTILAGFSFGALTAFVVAAKLPPAELWLFSLSPFFAEDLPNLSRTELEQLGAKRVRSAQETSFNSLASQISCPVKLFVGSEELSLWSEMLYRHTEAISKLSNVSKVVVEDVGHAIEYPSYINAIVENV